MGLFKKLYSTDSDENLMKHLAKGDHSAFNELYNRYSKNLYHFFYLRMWKDPEKAEDFVHDIMAKLIQNPDSFDISRSFKTWLFSIANNMVKNEYKRQEVRSGMQSYHQDETAFSFGHSRTENEIEDQFFKEALEKELADLDMKHREVFELRHVLGFSNREIAELMDINEGTVKSRIFYAIKQLSDKLVAFKPSY